MGSDHRIYSCDDHLDIFNLPCDLWTRRLPESDHQAAPHVEERGPAKLWFAGDRLMGPSGRIPGLPTALDRVDDIEDDGFRPSNPVLRLQDMERDGIFASIVYGPGTLFGFPIEDPELKKRVIRAWNDWAAEEFNSHAPERLSALPFLPTSSPEEAVEELHRALGLGHRGRSSTPSTRTWRTAPGIASGPPPPRPRCR